MNSLITGHPPCRRAGPEDRTLGPVKRATSGRPRRDSQVWPGGSGGEVPMRIAVTGSHGLIGSALVESIARGRRAHGGAGRAQRRSARRGPLGPRRRRDRQPTGSKGSTACVHLAGRGHRVRPMDRGPQAGGAREPDPGHRPALGGPGLARPPTRRAALGLGHRVLRRPGRRGAHRDRAPPGDGLPARGLPGVGGRDRGGRGGRDPRRPPPHRHRPLPRRRRPRRSCCPSSWGWAAGPGAGHQWLPWISIDDEVGRHPLPARPRRGRPGRPHRPPTGHERGVRPHPRSGAAPPRGAAHPPVHHPPPPRHRPAAGDLLFSSARVLPAALLDAGFAFGHTDLEATFRHLLDRPAA